MPLTSDSLRRQPDPEPEPQPEPEPGRVVFDPADVVVVTDSDGVVVGYSVDRRLFENVQGSEH